MPDIETTRGAWAIVEPSVVSLSELRPDAGTYARVYESIRTLNQIGRRRKDRVALVSVESSSRLRRFDPT